MLLEENARVTFSGSFDGAGDVDVVATASLFFEGRAVLRTAGHDIEMVGPFDEVMGHAGALVWHPDGLMEGAADPRSDGQVSAF